VVYGELMSAINCVKLKRKILKSIMKDLEKIRFSFKNIIGQRIYDLTYQLALDKGKRCVKHCNNQLLKHAMAGK